MKKRIIHFDDLDNARKGLRLHERATMQEIKSAYHRLAHQYHPDQKRSEDAAALERMKKINDSYHLLMDYCRNYRFSFLKQDYDHNYPEMNYQDRFKNDWLSSQ
ncbi:DnaJ domain-containing protein [bacterium]|nr:DnaJ domain-containing protein [bacterium]